MVEVQHDEITALGAAQIARRIATSDVSCREVVEAHIRRIEAVNPRLNALVVPFFDRARAEARAADAARKRGEPSGPLRPHPELSQKVPAGIERHAARGGCRQVSSTASANGLAETSPSFPSVPGRN
jgi:hypothetical protein